ncbi:MAG: Trm112 family protein [Hyphomicrobiaceae bacterium]
MTDEPAPPNETMTGAIASAAATQVPKTDRRLLELLVCPVTKTVLEYDEQRQELISRKAHLAFPIRRGVPHMVVAEARQLDD